MKQHIIEIDNISKKYFIGSLEKGYKTFREKLTDMFKSPFVKIKNFFSGEILSAAGLTQEIWALKNISLKIERGEVLGIIGPNGAGKSTLLKILSRITEPTEGSAIIRGRVGSLLEVGTGFNAELTGRENIYLNGSIIGMRKKEIDKKLEKIISFAEIGKFIDTPVKHYSSGMYLRLAFSVAAHLEPEILLVDEVLAVGDAQFQRKCLNKMEDVGKEGRTVLFVSHNMAAIQNLCSRVILIEEGKITEIGEPETVISNYLNRSNLIINNVTNLRNVKRRKKHFGKELVFTSCYIKDSKGDFTETLKLGELFTIYIEMKYNQDLKNVSFFVSVDDIRGVRITTVATEEQNLLYSSKKGDRVLLKLKFNDFVLNSGRYYLNLSARIGVAAIDYVKQAHIFSVSNLRETNARDFLDTSGLIKLSPIWNLQKLEN